MEFTDNDYLTAIRNNDSAVINAFYKTYYPVVHYIINKNSGSAEDIKDIFQDTCESLLKLVKNKDFELTCKLSVFLYSVCYKKWQNELRLRKNTSLLCSGMSALNNDCVDIPVEFYDILDMNLEEKLVAKHFKELQEDCQKILSLSADNHTTKEMADMLNTSEAYVKKRKSMCKGFLIEKVLNDPLFLETKEKKIYAEGSFYIIEKYINNDLDARFREGFEQKMQTDDSLKSQLQFQLAINKYIPNSETLKFRNILNNAHNEMIANNEIINNSYSKLELQRVKNIYEGKRDSDNGKNKRFLNRTWLYAAATIIIAVSIYTYNYVFNYSSENVYLAYYEKYESPGNIRTINQDSLDINLSISYYDKGEYSKAIDGFYSIDSSNSAYQMAHFYIAMSYIELKQSEKAISVLNELTKDKRHSYYYQSNWYLALSYIQLEQTEKAKSVLNLLVNAENHYKSKAKEVLDKLK
ncbi:MAG: hypothetical protein A2033_15305 [Bacteroidetes bacterium GWA2_31_9]|nr:MAG: hypothetical protein A2033_15305 [Bacteroidetes bacterium GWA2_31_9]